MLESRVGSSTCIRERKAYLSVLNVGLRDVDPKMEWYFPNHLLFRKPAGGWTEGAPHSVDSKLLGHLAEQQGRVGAQKQLPAGSDAGHRIAKPLDQRRAEVVWRIVEANDGLAGN